MPSPQNENAMR